MQDNQILIRRLREAKDYFAKENGHIVYRDTDGKLKVDQSKLRKEDNRNFEAYTKKILSNTQVLKKTESISAFNYQVTLYSSFFNTYNVEEVAKRLHGKAHVTSNLAHKNRDIDTITIDYR